MTQKTKLLRRLLWLYFFLVIFEGALRKWILPGLATPLLVARDPVCIAALWLGLPTILRSPWALGLVAIGTLSIPLAVAFGHGNLFVALFGARIYLLHFPMLFLFGSVFDRKDVWAFARVTLLIAIPMTVLLGLQFNTPQGHFLNVGIAGEGSSVFGGAAGRFRCSGTFSFTNGLSAFYCLAVALLAGWFACGPRPLPKWLWLAAGCLFVAVPLAISRTMAFSYALTGLFTVFAVGFAPQLLRTLVPAGIGLGLVLAMATQTAVFQDATEAFSARWESATRSEGGDEGVIGVVQNRIIDYGLLSGFKTYADLPLMGLGVGISTNAGAQIMTGERAFLVSEGEWGALLGEFGPFIGLGLILYRILLTLLMGQYALAAVRRGNPLPWILGSVASVAMFMGGTAQPTSLGFFVLSCGLFLAAFNEQEAESVAHPVPEAESDSESMVQS